MVALATVGCVLAGTGSATDVARRVVDADVLPAGLVEIRRTGIVHSWGERQVDTGSVAAQVLNVAGPVVGWARIAHDLRAAGEQISLTLGLAGGLPPEGS